MNHQPFRSWLVSEEELTTEQAQSLKDHLQTCDSCSQIEASWREVEAVLNRSAQLGPAPDFVLRWQVHLVEYQRYQQKRRGWYLIGATSLVVVSLLVALIIQSWSLIQAPGPYVAAWFERFMGLMSIYYTLRNLMASISLPGLLYSVVGATLLFGMISFMSVIWLATYRKVSFARRVV